MQYTHRELQVAYAAGIDRGCDTYRQKYRGKSHTYMQRYCAQLWIKARTISDPIAQEGLGGFSDGLLQCAYSKELEELYPQGGVPCDDRGY